MLKKDKYDKLHTFHNTGSQKDLDEYLKSKKFFKNLCHMKKVKYNEKKANNLIEKFAASDSKGFWGEMKLLLTEKRYMTILTRFIHINGFRTLKVY